MTSRILATAASLLLAAAVARAQPCADAPINYIFQSENPFLSDTPFAAMIGNGDIDDASPEANRLEIPVPAGEIGRTRVFGAIVSQLDPAGGGVRGWALSCMITGDLELVAGRADEGTVADPEDGLLSGAFFSTYMSPHVFLDDNPVITGSAVLSLDMPVTLPPVGTATVLAIELEAPEPQPLDESRRFESQIVWHEGGYAQPVGNFVTVEGMTVAPCREQDVTISFVRAPESPFRRGDTNTDGRVDISDAIRTFMFLFMGGTKPVCFDAADSNDDGRVDLSDGLHTLNDFFQPADTAIPSPGPFECGVDPTDDELTCTGYSACN